MTRLNDPIPSVSVRHQGNVAVVSVTGRLTVESPERPLIRTVRGLLEEGRKSILVDLEGVPQIDSSGLAELVEAFTTTTNKGGRFKLLHTTRSVDAILHITQLTRIFEMFDVEDEALRSFA